MRKIFGLSVLVTAALWGGCGCDRTYSNGSRAGVVQKFSHKGMVNKSWEGQLLMPAIVSSGDNGTVVASQVWQFSVADDKQDVIDALQAAVDSGKKVKLTYRQVLANGGVDFDTDYRIERVEILK